MSVDDPDPEWIEVRAVATRAKRCRGTPVSSLQSAAKRWITLNKGEIVRTQQENRCLTKYDRVREKMKVKVQQEAKCEIRN